MNNMRRRVVDGVRRLFSAPPLRGVRDGMLRIGERLDPTMQAISDPLDDVRAAAINDLENWAWHRLDGVYSRIRRSLADQTLHGRPNWRYGPDYVQWVARAAFERLAPVAKCVGGRFMEAGCGVYNPFAIACVMFLNGASDGVAFDRVAIDGRRSAEALFDLLADCALRPDRWHWSSLPRAEFMKRIQSFDADALRVGDLVRGIGATPIRYVKGDITGSLPVPAGSVDVMTSQHVLEHFLDFPSAARALRDIMAPGGVAYHDVDLVDHRVYGYLDPIDYRPERDPRNAERHLCSAWSFLTESEDWNDPVCNRLRKSEILKLMSDVGFEIVSAEGDRQPLPAETKSKLSPRFAAMSADDLETLRVYLVVRRT